MPAISNSDIKNAAKVAKLAAQIADEVRHSSAGNPIEDRKAQEIADSIETSVTSLKRVISYAKLKRRHSL